MSNSNIISGGYYNDNGSAELTAEEAAIFDAQEAAGTAHWDDSPMFL